METALTTTGIRQRFSRLACAGEYPDKAAAVTAIISEWNSALAVVIGDRVHDMEAATANGIPFIAAAYGYGSAETSTAVYRADSPREVLAYMEQIEKSLFK